MRLGPGLAATLAIFLSTSGTAADRFITLASTTSTQNSGLFDHILPRFAETSGIEVRVVAVGTGQALRLAKNCDADALLVHHRPSEEKFVAAGYGVARFDVMYNDFVLVGPAADPAGIRGETDVTSALRKIAAASAPFASRGDDSGTHRVERGLWQDAGIDVASASGGWYRETGSGMGATLNTAVGMQAYALSDRGTWLSFQNRGTLAILSEGNPRLFNPYGIIRVSEARCPNAKAADAQALVDWIVSVEGQNAISRYRLADQPLFFPNAARAGE